MPYQCDLHKDQPGVILMVNLTNSEQTVACAQCHDPMLLGLVQALGYTVTVPGQAPVRGTGAGRRGKGKTAPVPKTGQAKDTGQDAGESTPAPRTGPCEARADNACTGEGIERPDLERTYGDEDDHPIMCDPCYDGIQLIMSATSPVSDEQL